MKKPILSRRAILRGLGGGSLVVAGLPVLECMLDEHGTALAAGGALPVRLVTWGWGHGLNPARWVPEGVGQGSAWRLTGDLTSFEPVKEYLSIVSGHDGNSSHGGLIRMFCAGGKITLDHLAAAQAEFDSGSGIRSMQIAISRNPNTDTNYNHVSRNAAGRVMADADPLSVFNRLFRPGSIQETALAARARIAAPSPWVLDALRGEISRLRPRLGAADRLRVDEHLQGLHDLDKRLRAVDSPAMSAAPGCRRPAAPPAHTQPNDSTQMHNQAHTSAASLMGDIVAMAFACDRTRVFSIAYTYAAGWDRFAGYGGTEHGLTHNPGKWVAIGYPHMPMKMKALATFFEKLKAVPEGTTNALHNTVVLATTDTSDPSAHTGKNLPVIIGGRAGGRLRGNVHHQGEGGNALDAAQTVAAACGIRNTGGGRSPIGALFA